jgi:hypothetical protein
MVICAKGRKFLPTPFDSKEKNSFNGFITPNGEAIALEDVDRKGQGADIAFGSRSDEGDHGGPPFPGVSLMLAA